MAARNKRGEAARAVRVSMEPIHTQMVALFNVSSNYEQFLGAALIPALLHILAMTAGAWTVGRELRDSSLGQWLGDALGTGGLLHTAGSLIGKLALPWATLTLAGLLAFIEIGVLVEAVDLPVRFYQPGFALHHWLIVAAGLLAASWLQLKLLRAARKAACCWKCSCPASRHGCLKCRRRAVPVTHRAT